MRLIDPKELRAALIEWRDNDPYKKKRFLVERWVRKVGINALIRFVSAFSTIEAEPVQHGRWETFLDEDWGGNTTYLHGHKKCGYVFRSCLEKGTPYCPNCGCKMDGDSHE